jgi:hypothetical protein
MLSSNERFGVVHITRVAMIVSARLSFDERPGKVILRAQSRSEINSTGLATLSVNTDNTSYILVLISIDHTVRQNGARLSALTLLKDYRCPYAIAAG